MQQDEETKAKRDCYLPMVMPRFQVQKAGLPTSQTTAAFNQVRCFSHCHNTGIVLTVLNFPAFLSHREPKGHSQCEKRGRFREWECGPNEEEIAYLLPETSSFHRGWLQWPTSTANSLTLTTSGPLGLDSPQWPLPQGPRGGGRGSKTSGHVPFLSDIPFHTLHPRHTPSGCLQGLYFLLHLQPFLPSKASSASPPDCLTAVPDKYASSWVSVGNEVQPAAGCGYGEKIKTLTKSFGGNLEGEF